MFFPPAFLLIPYGIVLLAFALMSLVYLYHLLRYGGAYMGTYIFIILYVTLALSIIGISWGYIATLPL